MSPQVFFPQPVVAVSVIIHLGSDGYTPVDTDTKYMRVDLLTPENRTVPVVPGNIPVSCRENPVLVPIKQDLSKPFFLTQGTYKFTGYNMHGVIFIPRFCNIKTKCNKNIRSGVGIDQVMMIQVMSLFL